MLKAILFLLVQISFLTNVIGQSYKSFSIVPASYVFKLNKTQGYNSTQNQIDEKNVLFYRSVESPVSAIEIFDLKTGDLKQTVSSKKFTINSFVKTDDERFWIHDTWGKKFILVEKNAKIIREIKEVSRKNVDLLSIDSKFRPILFYNNEILTTGLFLFRKDLDTKSAYYKRSGIVRGIDMNNKTRYIGRIAPSAETNFYGNSNVYSYTLNGNQLIVAPYFSDEIQIINLLQNTTTFINIKSKYAQLIKPMAPIGQFSSYTNAQNS